MAAPERSIFRESAIKKYLQKQEQGILLRVASPPIVLFFWVALLFLLGAGGLAWSIQVPISVRGQGLILEQGAAASAIGYIVIMYIISPLHTAYIHTRTPHTASV